MRGHPFGTSLNGKNAVSISDVITPISCRTSPVSRQKLVDIFLAWAKVHPDLLDGDSPIHGVMRAASDKWPCEK